MEKDDLKQFPQRYLKLPEEDYEASEWNGPTKHKLTDNLTVVMEDSDPYEFASIYKDDVLILQEYCICPPQDAYVKQLRGDIKLLEFINANF